MANPKVNWSSTPRSARKRPVLEGCTMAPDVMEALKSYMAEHKRTKSDVVESALRQYLGVEKPTESA